MQVDLAGHVRLALRGEDVALQRLLEVEMRPYMPVPDGAETGDVPAVELAPLAPDAPPLVELQQLAGDGFVTGSDGNSLYLLDAGRRASVPDVLADDPPRISVESGFPARSLFRQLVRPALQLRALTAGSLALHGSAVVRDGLAIVVAGWSESGKTETALALMERGAAFLSDKWTLVAPGTDDSTKLTAAPFPISVGIRRWVLRYLPRLRTAMPRRARLQFAAASSFGFVSRPVRGRRRGGAAGRVAGVAERALALADRAALAPDEVAAAYGHVTRADRVPVELVVVLRTVPDGEPGVAEADRSAMARRLAASAVTERQGYLALRHRAAYALDAPITTADVAAREAERIEQLFATVPVVEVSSPFPVDPRQVVAALDPWLKR